MRNFAIGFLYLFTLGVYGVGWVLDGFFMPSLVDQSNTKEKYTTDLEILKTYLIAASPFGVLGGHQYYSGRKLWGLAYTLTLGGCGVWWMIDLFRISAIVHRRKEWKLGINLHKLYADDVYLIWILFGLLGGHHFYMKRFKAGFLYMFTFGCLGVGWLVDIIRIPWMVRDYNFAHSPEDDLVFSDAVMESLSDFDRKIIQRAIRRARYSGEDNSIYEDETDDDDRMFDKESCNHELDQIRSSIRSLQRPKFEVGGNEEIEWQSHRSHNMSKVTTVAIISNPDESIMLPAKKNIIETPTLTHENENEKHSDDIEIKRTNSRKRNKSHEHETKVILNPTSLSNGLNEQSDETEIYTRSMDRNRSLNKECSILKRDSGSRNDNIVKVRNKGRRVSFHFDDRKMNVDEQDNSNSTMDNNENSQSQEACQTDHPKESNQIQTENLEIKQYRRINRRVKSDAALEMAENRKRKLNRSNTQVASLSWQDPVENKSSVVSNLLIEQTNNDNSTTCEGNVNQVSLPRITKIRSIKRSKSREAKAKSMVSSATTQTSPRTPRNESDINYDLASDSFVQNGSLENNIKNSNKNENYIDACQNISEGVLRIVTSATVDNVFDDIEEIKVDHGTPNSTPTPSPSSELCRPVRDTGIGFQNIIPEFKPGTKRSMSFPSRQISLEQDKVIQNGHMLVVDDGESPFIPLSESARSTKRLSPQPGLNGWTNIDQEVTRPIRRSSMNTDNSGWTSGNKINQPVRRASTQSAGMSKWTDDERKPRKRKVSLMPKITRAKSGRI